ncbi:MAG TPA: hypothetical protein VM223_07790, partial [Planctomycetota bacterium]|nr:hypothetical protein [Planctomycetota bacterium]
MPFLPVDTAVVVRVGPAIDDTDFKTREAVAYNAAGINVDLHESTVAGTKGAFTTTAITPEDPAGAAGNRWTSIGEGYHELEITAAQNNTEGELQVVALATGVLHFESAVYTVVPVAVFNSLVAGTDRLGVDAQEISSDATVADNLELIIENAKGADHKILISTDAQDLKGTLTVGSYLKGILATALTETGGYLAAGFKKFFNVETPVATAETVNQTGDAYAVVAHADHGNAKLVRSTTPANTLDVAATGEAGLDFNNIKAATGATTLTNITVPIVTTVGTTTTNTDMRGTDGAYTGTPPTVGAIRTEMEGAGTKLTAVHAVIPATAPPTNTQLEARTLAAADYGTAANQTTLLNRIGAFTGTGLNTILGFLKALMSKAGGLTPS